MQSELDQVKATLDKTQAELDAAKIKLQEAEKWKQEYDKLYVVNQNLEGQIQALKKLMTQLQKNIKSDKDTIKELQQKLQE